MILDTLATGLLALGFVFLVEGLAYALAPSLVERLLAIIATLDEGERRRVGLFGMVCGLLLLWVARNLGA